MFNVFMFIWVSITLQVLMSGFTCTQQFFYFILSFYVPPPHTHTHLLSLPPPDFLLSSALFWFLWKCYDETLLRLVGGVVTWQGMLTGTESSEIWSMFLFYFEYMHFSVCVCVRVCIFQPWIWNESTEVILWHVSRKNTGAITLMII